MSARRARIIAWSLLGVAVALLGATGLLELRNQLTDFDDGTFGYGMIFLPFAIVGAIVASRRPEQTLGWLFFVVALPNIAWAVATQYAIYAQRTGAGPPLVADLASWLAIGWPGDIGWWALALYLPLLFPTGRLPSPRWRGFAWFAAGVMAVNIAARMVDSGPVQNVGSLANVPNPFGSAALGALPAQVTGVIDVVAVAFVPVAVVALVLRWRGSDAIVRQQLKWFVYSASLLPALLLVGMLLSAAGVHLRPEVMAGLSAVVLVAVVSAIGLAILRYRLWDIDVIIRRTLAYTVVTATLGAIYLLTIITLQALFVRLTGQESTLAVVASTLAIAALFGPLRAWVQRFIDRRFFRKKYDARRVLAQFAQRAQREAELDALSADLLATVDEALKPSEVRLWLVRR